WRRPRWAACRRRGWRSRARMGSREAWLAAWRGWERGPPERERDRVAHVARVAVGGSETRFGHLQVALLVGAEDIGELFAHRGGGDELRHDVVLPDGDRERAVAQQRLELRLGLDAPPIRRHHGRRPAASP